MDFPLHLIPLLPLGGAALSLLFGRRLGKTAVTTIALSSVALAALLSLKATLLIADLHGGGLTDQFFAAPWMKAGDLQISAGLAFDRLTAVMCLVVTGIGFLIHLYSTSYMAEDPGYTRFFGYLNLFTGAMLILVLGDSLPVTFVGWEGVGLCSYLLIGFWYERDAFASAGRKAFIVNRVGDFGFLLAMFLLFAATKTLKYSELGAHLDGLVAPLWFGLPAAYFIGLLVLVGASGKSAQIPLYVWLPDAMAGPTPVSALIHAATMVTAGVYVVARMHPLFEAAPATLAAVAAIGAATALFAATIAIVQTEFKKVLAYSTISQLGFMFVGVGSYLSGTANYQAGLFHLVTHAFFKAGLFLGAGSVMHAIADEKDILRMGGLKRYLPHTRWTFLIYCLAIAGIFPFAGFWSKDAILGGAYEAIWPVGPHPHPAEVWFATHTGHLLYGTLLVAAGCTAFYMFRLYFLVFEGEYRGDPQQLHHIHESPPAMTVVLWLLALGSIGVGLLGIPNVVHEGADRFGDWLAPVIAPQARAESAHDFWFAAAIALGVSLVGIGGAALLYFRGRPGTSEASFARRLLFNGYYVDNFYDLVIVRPLRWSAIILWKAIDTFFIDLLLVNGVGFVVTGFGRLIRYLQNGDVQRYVVGILAGTAAVLYIAANYTAQKASHFTVNQNGAEVDVVAEGAGEEGHRVRFQVDWSDGITPPQRSTIFHHRYEGSGKKQIVLEAIDPRWGVTVRRSQVVTIP